MYTDITAALGTEGLDARTAAPLTLAWIGDCVWELFVRAKLTAGGSRPVGLLTEEEGKLSRARSQCLAAERLNETFTEDEASVFRRGKNAKIAAKPKNATVKEYRTATGWEAVIGWLYLTGQEERLSELAREAFRLLEEDE